MQQWLRELRFAATLADVVHSVRLTVRNRDQVVLSVARHTADEAFEIRVPSCQPDAFRVSVSRLYQRQHLGEPQDVFESLVGHESAIEVVMDEGDQIFGGGIYRFVAGDRHLHMNMTTLSSKRCLSVLRSTFGEQGKSELSQQQSASCDWRRIGFHYDPLTEVTVVHCFAEEHDALNVHAVMEKILESLVTTELLDELGATVVNETREVRTPT